MIGRRNRPREKAEHRASHFDAGMARARSRVGELKVATYNVRILSFTRKNGAGHAEVVLQKCRAVGCDLNGLQETTETGQNRVTAEGYRAFCRGVDGGKGRVGQCGARLAVKYSICYGSWRGGEGSARGWGSHSTSYARRADWWILVLNPTRG